MRIVPVQLDPAGRILVVLAVAVVVDPLGKDLVDAFFALGGIRRPEEPGLLGIRDKNAFRILHPHLGDRPVLVQVLEAVLVDGSVGIFVDRTGIDEAARADRPEVRLRSVRIEQGGDIDCPGVEKSSDLPVFLHVSIDQFSGQAEGRLGPGDMAAVQSGRDQHGRAETGRGLDRRIAAGEPQDRDLPAAGAFPDDFQGGHSGEPGREILQGGNGFRRLAERAA